MSAAQPPRPEDKSPEGRDAPAADTEAAEAERIATTPPVKQMDNMAAAVAAAKKGRRPKPPKP